MNAAPACKLRGEVESPRPLRAAGGFVSVQGWCVAEDQAEPPEVRLVTTAATLPMTARQTRADVPRLLPGQPAAARAGFTIEGRLPAGVHLARFEARLPDGSWPSFKTLTLTVTAAPLATAVETPAPGGRITQRVAIDGWALHPDQPVKSLSLRYGHQEISCLLGGQRPDLARQFPGIAQTGTAGFRSEFILHAGRGPLRLKAVLADGSIALARTALEIDIPTDENHGPEIDFTAARIALPDVAPQSTPPPPPLATRPLNLLFILYGSFASNSAQHVAALANELCAAGHRCLVAVPHDPATLGHHGPVAFGGITHAAAADRLVFPDGRGPDLIHAWTTRENVRRLAEKIQATHRCRLIVHLEDNEQEILALTLQRPMGELEQLPESELDRLIPPDLSHPRRSRQFLAAADGVTVITETLRDFVPAGRPCHTITPAADARYFHPRPQPLAFREALGLPPETTLLFYHGNVHAANAAEMRELYGAVIRLNREGHATQLIRTGRDQVDFLGPLAAEAAPFVLACGEILHHRHLPALMALADIFVQPGREDAFNHYRFPSKLPEFFALGRPVVLPRTNLGTTLRHGIDAYVLEVADAPGITAAVRALRDDRALHDRLARGAVAFAAGHFDWRRSAEALARFYATLAAS